MAVVLHGPGVDDKSGRRSHFLRFDCEGKSAIRPHKAKSHVVLSGKSPLGGKGVNSAGTAYL